MAAGYMHTPIITLLVESGADPELRDNKGQSVVGLIEGLRAAMPLNMATVQRRLALEEVANTLTDRCDALHARAAACAGGGPPASVIY